MLHYLELASSLLSFFYYLLNLVFVLLHLAVYYHVNDKVAECTWDCMLYLDYRKQEGPDFLCFCLTILCIIVIGDREGEFLLEDAFI